MSSNDVTDNADLSRYEIRVDGELAGFSDYRLAGDTADFVHTEVFDEFSGQGLATELIQQALDDSRRRGRNVMPHCSFVRDFIAENPAYEDLVPEDRRGRFGLGSSAASCRVER